MKHKIKLKIAIGVSRKSGCVIEIIEDASNVVDDDIAEFGNSLEDLFYEGSVPPTDAGVYLFDGIAESIDHDSLKYIGTFTRLEISKVDNPESQKITDSFVRYTSISSSGYGNTQSNYQGRHSDCILDFERYCILRHVIWARLFNEKTGDVVAIYSKEKGINQVVSS